ncbi:hypothetical protein MMC10_000751 [Thelotrema lepadinum]|nr:hypothetical protein [Thelotrema lepadinum]
MLRTIGSAVRSGHQIIKDERAHQRGLQAKWDQSISRSQKSKSSVAGTGSLKSVKEAESNLSSNANEPPQRRKKRNLQLDEENDESDHEETHKILKGSEDKGKTTMMTRSQARKEEKSLSETKRVTRSQASKGKR